MNISSRITEEINPLVLDGPVEIDECLIYRGKRGYEGRARPYVNRVWLFGLKRRVALLSDLYPPNSI